MLVAVQSDLVRTVHAPAGVEGEDDCGDSDSEFHGFLSCRGARTQACPSAVSINITDCE